MSCAHQYQPAPRLFCLSHVLVLAAHIEMSPFPTQVLLELDGSPIAAVVVVTAITVSGAVLYYASSKAFSAFVHRMFELQLSKAVNCTRVTCGCCELSLLDGTFEARDIVCHTPHREEWKWDSPLIGRCGYMRVRFSFLSCVPFGQRFLRYPAKEVYSVLVCDMQVFVEKRANVSCCSRYFFLCCVFLSLTRRLFLSLKRSSITCCLTPAWTFQTRTH